jgi:hypothetical protein
MPEPPPDDALEPVDSAWVNDPADFAWEEDRPHVWYLRHLPTDAVPAQVRWDERHGWDAYGNLTHGYIDFPLEPGIPVDARHAAMDAALDYALRRPVR